MHATLMMEQKLAALSFKYYSLVEWKPKAGDYYTTSRCDLELYRIVEISDGYISTEYCTSPGQLSKWKEECFTTEGFGGKRVWVPDWILVSEP